MPVRQGRRHTLSGWAVPPALRGISSGIDVYKRQEINAVGGYYAFGKELCNGDSVFDFDTTCLLYTSLSIHS